jgi:hypothetical protein
MAQSEKLGENWGVLGHLIIQRKSIFIALLQWRWVASPIEALTKSRLAVQAFIAVDSAITMAVAKLVIMTACACNKTP